MRWFARIELEEVVDGVLVLFQGLRPEVQVGLTSIGMFVAFMALGLANRRRGAVHKRYMVLAMIAILSPATARLMAALDLGAFRNVFVPGAAAAFVIACLVHDWRRYRVVHPVYVIGGAVIVASWPWRCDWSWRMMGLDYPRTPWSACLDEAELVDASMKKVLRTWQLPYQTVPAGISADGAKLYLDFYTQFPLEDLLLELSEDGRLAFRARAEVGLHDDGERIESPAGSDLSFLRFQAGGKTYIVRFLAPCT